MNKILTFALVLVCITMTGFAQSSSTIAKGVPMNSSDAPITGFVALATPTLTLNNTATIVGTLPANTVAIVVTASGAINYGDSSVLTSTDGKYPTIATTESKRFPIYPHKTNPSIYLINNATGTASVARITAEVQR